MKCCTFFGHADCPDAIRPKLLEAIRGAIAEGVTEFFVGDRGRFDALALGCLRELKREYPGIDYAVVLAYLPAGSESLYAPGESLFPEGAERAPKRFAIDYRNRWMLSRSDTVIAFVHHPGGAAKYIELAKRAGKQILMLFL